MIETLLKHCRQNSRPIFWHFVPHSNKSSAMTLPVMIVKGALSLCVIHHCWLFFQIVYDEWRQKSTKKTFCDRMFSAMLLFSSLVPSLYPVAKRNSSVPEPMREDKQGFVLKGCACRSGFITFEEAFLL